MQVGLVLLRLSKRITAFLFTMFGFWKKGIMDPVKNYETLKEIGYNSYYNISEVTGTVNNTRRATLRFV